MVASLWGNYDTVLADLDGVIYEGKSAIEHAVDTINALQASGIAIGYVTNNSSRRPETIVEQLSGYGLRVKPEEIIGSAVTGTELLSQMIPKGAKVLVVGGDGLRTRVQESGFKLVASADENPAGVIQGFAPDVSWKDLAEASFAIQRGAVWVATNSDWTLPLDRGLAPGNGTLVSAVHTAVGQLPVVAGKPEPAIFHTALRQFNTTHALFIGDRIDTDIVGANRAGIDSALVLTGVATRKEVLGAKPEERPKYVLANLSELLSDYQSPKKIKHGYQCDGSEVELLGNKVLVTHGDPKSIGALKAACAVIHNSDQPIFALDVEPALYE